MFNKILSLVILIILLPLLIIIAFFIFFLSNGPILHWSKRISINNNMFYMPKFRTMHINTPQKATHLMLNGEKHLTKVGSFLRKTSLDELPQLYSIIKGDMSFIGPRPALFNQHDLINLRTKHKIHLLRPGITGWAQINGRDEISIEDKVVLEIFYLNNRSLMLDLKIVFLTIIKVFKKDSISH